MKIKCNKICLTEKGLEFITREKEDLIESHNRTRYEDSMIRSRSLPTIKQNRMINQPTLIKELSQLSREKIKLEKIGLKKLYEQKEDEFIKMKLTERLKDSHNYVQSIIPNLVKMTKKQNHDGKFESRFEQARMYAARLQQNYERKFVFRSKIKSEHTH